MTGPLTILAFPGSAHDGDNPYVGLLYAAMQQTGDVHVEELTRARLRQQFDVIHVHWPEYFARWGTRHAVPDMVKGLALLALARRNGAKLIWTGHDLEPHELPNPAAYRFFIGIYSTMVDGLISMSHAAEGELMARYPRLRSSVPRAVIPHGHYRSAYELVDRSESRQRLGISGGETVYLALGQLRRYKQLTQTVKAFDDFRDASERLLIAGDPREAELFAELEEIERERSYITLIGRKLTAHEVSAMHAASDVVVLSYRQQSVLHSGAALTALSLNRPVAIAHSSTMRELQDVVGPEWLALSDGSPAGTLSTARAALRVVRGTSPDLSNLEWSGLAGQTVDFMRSVRDA
jgi:beta-1,4-mannosyltransferase